MLSIGEKVFIPRYGAGIYTRMDVRELCGQKWNM